MTDRDPHPQPSPALAALQARDKRDIAAAWERAEAALAKPAPQVQP